MLMNNLRRWNYLLWRVQNEAKEVTGVLDELEVSDQHLRIMNFECEEHWKKVTRGSWKQGDEGESVYFRSKQYRQRNEARIVPQLWGKCLAHGILEQTNGGNLGKSSWMTLIWLHLPSNSFTISSPLNKKEFYKYFPKTTTSMWCYIQKHKFLLSNKLVKIGISEVKQISFLQDFSDTLVN